MNFIFIICFVFCAENVKKKSKRKNKNNIVFNQTPYLPMSQEPSYLMDQEPIFNSPSTNLYTSFHADTITEIDTVQPSSSLMPNFADNLLFRENDMEITCKNEDDPFSVPIYESIDEYCESHLEQKDSDNDNLDSMSCNDQNITTPNTSWQQNNPSVKTKPQKTSYLLDYGAFCKLGFNKLTYCTDETECFLNYKNYIEEDEEIDFEGDILKHLTQPIRIKLNNLESDAIRLGKKMISIFTRLKNSSNNKTLNLLHGIQNMAELKIELTRTKICYFKLALIYTLNIDITNRTELAKKIALMKEDTDPKIYTCEQTLEKFFIAEKTLIYNRSILQIAKIQWNIANCPNKHEIDGLMATINEVMKETYTEMANYYGEILYSGIDIEKIKCEYERLTTVSNQLN
ncbi:hypothetical protein SLOPH_1076 [Spraguea lophii 42_110]|uniref:Uncharacterized protein n=1 Tax=Spraguea lophii (strain 42_110) TaxID=1358809 RepID=S7XHT8_SPRLO|nr:hypothetical protein SLOPH_1076 [Spraguea lophii 42_110]